MGIAMSERIKLNRSEQIFLMEMLDTNEPMDAVEQFAALMVLEFVNPAELEKYVKAIMKRMK